MNIYKISIEFNIIDYLGKFSSAVVFAETVEEARKMHPSGCQENWNNSSWAETPNGVDVDFLGVCDMNLTLQHAHAHVICSSFKSSC